MKGIALTYLHTRDTQMKKLVNANKKSFAVAQSTKEKEKIKCAILCALDN